MSEMGSVRVIGGGLAGSEAAWHLAELGIDVDLYEMRPHNMTPAHSTGLLGELVCSNSLKSEDLSNAAGLLKAEMRLKLQRTPVAASSASTWLHSRAMVRPTRYLGST